MGYFSSYLASIYDLFVDFLASDDTTCYLWEPKKSKQPIIQMTGHSKIINIVSFSPDGKLIATAAFDKNIRVWSNKGKYVTFPFYFE